MPQLLKMNFFCSFSSIFFVSYFHSKSARKWCNFFKSQCHCGPTYKHLSYACPTALSLSLLGYAIRPPPAREEEPPARCSESQWRPPGAAQIVAGCPQPVLGQDGNTGRGFHFVWKRHVQCMLTLYCNGGDIHTQQSSIFFIFNLNMLLTM